MTQLSPPAWRVARDPLTSGHEWLRGGHEVRPTVIATLARPRLAVVSDVLSAEECDLLMRQAETSMTRSEVITADNAGTTPDETRTSSGMYFEPGRLPLADDVQRRMMAMMGMPIDHGEPLQVLRYGPGDVYQPHFDFFEPDGADHVDSTVGLYGQRVATMICYLADVDEGGATCFPEVGLEIRPRRGMAVYFTYVDADGAVDRTSLHGGAPVITGEKWILTQWARSRPYRLDDR